MKYKRMHSRQRKSYLVNFEYFTDEISNHRGQHHQEAHQPAVTGNQLCSGGFLCIKIDSIINGNVPNSSFKYHLLFICNELI